MLRELPVDVKEKRSGIVVFYLAKSFTESLETSEFHDSMLLLTFLRRCSYSYDDQSDRPVWH